MEFRILGPLEVLDDGRRIALSGDKQRALLALLLVHANRALSSERLIDELWGERPPASAAKTLQVRIARLRKALERSRASDGGGVIVTREHGYELQVDSDGVDALRFERLIGKARDDLSAGRIGRACSSLEEALSLWRGPPLAEFAYERFAELEIARLEELRTAALEELIETKLALGRHGDVVSELERLIVEHPYRERLRGQLMLALYRCDRQAEALQAYQNARRTLVGELGIEPGQRLRGLERAILAQDPALAIAEGVPAGSPRAPAEAALSAFVGREAELDALVAGLDDAFGGRGGLFLLVGEPGIGKSRLAMELLGDARERGARVLVGRCWEAGGAPAYWPWVQSLREYVRSCDAGRLRSGLGARAADVAQLVPELHELLPGLQPRPAVDVEGARFRMFDAVSSFLRAESRSCPIVLGIDDLHAADESSLLLLRFLARELSDSQILVIGALRNVDPRMGKPLAATIADVSREAVTHRIDLGGLGDHEVARFVQLAAGHGASDALVETIHSQTGGNPLFVKEIVQLLLSEGRLAEYPNARLEVPRGLGDAIGRRIDRLSERCATVLTSASVLGREFRIDALERVAGIPRVELIEALDEANAEGIAADVPGARGRLRFAHAIIRDTVYGRLSQARRMSLHAQAGAALDRLYGENAEPHLAELAHHYAQAGAAGDDEKAVRYARLAADRAARLLAFEEAARLYELALDIAGDQITAEERLELTLSLGDVQARAGTMDEARATFIQAVQLARQLGSGEQLARAALGYGGRFSYARAGMNELVIPLLEEALAALNATDSPLRARLLARLAGAHRGEASREPRASLARAAIDVARRVGDPATLGYVLEGAQLALWHTTDPEQRAAVGDELLVISQRIGDQERAVLGGAFRFVSWIELGDLSSADVELAQMHSVATQLGQPAQISWVTICHAMRALLTGALSEAEKLIHEVLRLGERAETWVTAWHRMQLCALRREQGRLAEIEQTVQQSLGEHRNYPIWRCVLTYLHAAAGDLGKAREGFEDLARDQFRSLPVDEEWTYGMTLLTEVCVALADVERAETLYQLLVPYSRLVAYGAPEVSTGAVSRYLGMLAASLSRWNDAEQRFRHALQLNTKIQAAPWLARTQVDYGHMLISRGAPGDRTHADQLIGQAVATFQSLGMRSHAARASTLELHTQLVG